MSLCLAKFLEVICEDEAFKPSLGKGTTLLPPLHQPSLLLPSTADHLTPRSAHSSGSYLGDCSRAIKGKTFARHLLIWIPCAFQRDCLLQQLWWGTELEAKYCSWLQAPKCCLLLRTFIFPWLVLGIFFSSPNGIKYVGYSYRSGWQSIHCNYWICNCWVTLLKNFTFPVLRQQRLYTRSL